MNRKNFGCLWLPLAGIGLLLSIAIFQMVGWSHSVITQPRAVQVLGSTRELYLFVEFETAEHHRHFFATDYRPAPIRQQQVVVWCDGEYWHGPIQVTGAKSFNQNLSTILRHQDHFYLVAALGRSPTLLRLDGADFRSLGLTEQRLLEQALGIKQDKPIPDQKTMDQISMQAGWQVLLRQDWFPCTLEQSDSFMFPHRLKWNDVDFLLVSLKKDNTIALRILPLGETTIQPWDLVPASK